MLTSGDYNGDAACETPLVVKPLYVSENGSAWGVFEYQIFPINYRRAEPLKVFSNRAAAEAFANG